MDEFKKLLEQKAKEGKKMSEEEKGAKMGVLKELRGMANAEIGRDLPGLKKVTVASDSKEGLEKGLEKAEDIVDGGMAEASEQMSDEELMGDEFQMKNADEASDLSDMKSDGSSDYEKACELARGLKDEEKAKLIEDLSKDMA